jgi:sensor histidine kinase regulating citrate/malate metabolism
MKRLILRVKHKESRKKIVKGFIQILLFDFSLFLLWYFYILPHEHYTNRSLSAFMITIGILPLFKLLIGIRLLITLEDGVENRVSYINDELLVKKKEKAKEDLTSIKSLFEEGNSKEALDYINKTFSFDTTNDYDLTDCLTVNTIVNHYNNVLAGTDINFEFEVPDKLSKVNSEVRITRKPLNTILGNFIDNAIEAHSVSTKSNKMIKLTVDIEHNQICYGVSNNAKMIKDVTKIFEPRYSTKGNSRGYGLVAVERAAVMINGVLEVQSTKEDTSFKVVVSR